MINQKKFIYSQRFLLLSTVILRCSNNPEFSVIRIFVLTINLLLKIFFFHHIIQKTFAKNFSAKFYKLFNFLKTTLAITFLVGFFFCWFCFCRFCAYLYSVVGFWFFYRWFGVVFILGSSLGTGINSLSEGSGMVLISVVL